LSTWIGITISHFPNLKELLIYDIMFGTIIGRFYLKEDLGFEDDDTPDTVTISELIETFSMWPIWTKQLHHKKKQLFTMFETSDVHPDIIECMKVFDKVIVPYEYLKDILVKHGIPCEALNTYTSPLIRHTPTVIHKTPNPDRLVFLYVGTNDVRKNLVELANIFKGVLRGTSHKLIVKTNKMDNLPESDNIKYITRRLSYDEMAGLYNICDYVVSFSHGEGVGLPMLEAKYFGRPVISHTGGVLSSIKDDSWIVLPSNVPDFLKKVFHGTWWDIEKEETLRILNNII
jgi:glycosyltransferase involved in cell wall biosynthesis